MSTGRRLRAAMIAAPFAAGCFHFDAWTPVPGVEPGVSTASAVARWTCEGGDELSLLPRGNTQVLHRASDDYVLSTSWTASEGLHFGVAAKQLGVEEIVPSPPTGDLLVRRYLELGDWSPKVAGARYADGQPVGHLHQYGVDAQGHPQGDPWTEELCWSNDGPLAKAAAAAGRKPIDLLYFGAQRFHGTPPASAKALKPTTCKEGRGEDADEPTLPPFAKIFVDASPTPGASTVWLMDPRGDDDRGIVAHDAKDDGAGCLLAYSADSCVATAKVQSQGGRVFYWEHVRTGYELFQGKRDGDFLLMVYAPTQVTSAPLPPDKTALGHPLDPKAEAMTCLYQ